MKQCCCRHHQQQMCCGSLQLSMLEASQLITLLQLNVHHSVAVSSGRAAAASKTAGSTVTCGGTVCGGGGSSAGRLVKSFADGVCSSSDCRQVGV